MARSPGTRGEGLRTQPRVALDATRAGKEVYYRPDYGRMVGSAEQLLAYLKSCARCAD